MVVEVVIWESFEAKKKQETLQLMSQPLTPLHQGVLVRPEAICLYS